MKKALITGISGQDGSYLAQLLLRKGYEVHGVTRQSNAKPWRHDHLQITDRVTLHTSDLLSLDEVQTLVKETGPDQIFHLAAQSSVPESIHNPVETVKFNILATLHLLESVRGLKPEARLFHASSSEIFDPKAKSPLTKSSPIKPTNPYSTAKAACHFLVQNYRENYGLFAVNGILFPHESPLRDRRTLLKLFVSQALLVKKGELQKISIASPDNVRDMGDARSYVEAMSLSLEVDTPDDYIICSGSPVTIQSVIDTIVKKFDLPQSVVQIDESLVRDVNPRQIFGDAEETFSKLGWRNKLTLDETIEAIIEFQTNT